MNAHVPSSRAAHASGLRATAAIAFLSLAIASPAARAETAAAAKAAQPESAAPQAKTAAPQVEAAAAKTQNPDELGIQVLGLRRSAAGYMIDFRFKLLDAEKAAALLDPKRRPYLVDEATGAKLGVPDTPKLGALRSTSRNGAMPGRNYYVLFANPGRFLAAGSKVTLVAGDMQIRHITLQ